MFFLKILLSFFPLNHLNFSNQIRSTLISQYHTIYLCQSCRFCWFSFVVCRLSVFFSFVHLRSGIFLKGRRKKIIQERSVWSQVTLLFSLPKNDNVLFCFDRTVNNIAEWPTEITRCVSSITKSSPHHHQSNGKAESAVKIRSSNLSWGRLKTLL